MHLVCPRTKQQFLFRLGLVSESFSLSPVWNSLHSTWNGKEKSTAASGERQTSENRLISARQGNPLRNSPHPSSTATVKSLSLPTDYPLMVMKLSSFMGCIYSALYCLKPVVVRLLNQLNFSICVGLLIVDGLISSTESLKVSVGELMIISLYSSSIATMI